jgi:hypothetical protein
VREFHCSLCSVLISLHCSFILLVVGPAQQYKRSSDTESSDEQETVHIRHQVTSIAMKSEDRPHTHLPPRIDGFTLAQIDFHCRRLPHFIATPSAISTLAHAGVKAAVTKAGAAAFSAPTCPSQAELTHWIIDPW